MKITENYHTHTSRCNHAVGTIMEYVEAAVDAGVKILGISDHVPFPDNRWLDSRMRFEELPEYEREIAEARKRFPEIKILQALECEYSPADHDYLLSYKENPAYDYLISGNHWVIDDTGYMYDSINSPEILKIQENQLIEIMESNLFAFIAHPDMCFGEYQEWDKYAEEFTVNICKTAVKTSTPLEINGYGFRKPMINTPNEKRYKYPLREFWKTASQFEIEVICNSDAHRPQDIIANISDAREIANSYNLKFANLHFD